jgi:hypothetical protein
MEASINNHEGGRLGDSLGAIKMTLIHSQDESFAWLALGA